MLKEIARYGSFNKRDAPEQTKSENVDKPVSKKKPRDKKQDVFNPWAIYDFDIDFDEEVVEDGSDIHEQRGSERTE